MGILVIAVLVLLARFVVFKKQFDNWEEGIDRIDTWEVEYKKEHPNATKEDTDKAFDDGMSSLKKWQDEYMKNNPGATKAEMDAAFNAAWNQ